MASTAQRKDVLLVFPGRHKAPDPQVPLQLLHVAAALRQGGLRRAHRGHCGCRTIAPSPLGDPVFVGITAMSGPQIRYGLEFARRVRAEKPGMPHRLGRRAPDAAARADRGQRRASTWSCAARASSSSGLSPTRSPPARRSPTSPASPSPSDGDGDQHPRRRPHRPRRHPARAALRPARARPLSRPCRPDASTSRPAAAARTAAASATTPTSTGAVGAARARSASSTRWQFAARALPAHEDHRPGRRQLLRRPRRASRRSAEGILERGISVAWRANCRFDYLAKYDGDFLGLIERAGCMELDFGGESGSRAHAGLRLQGRHGRRDRHVGRQPAPLGAVHRPLRLVAERPARRDVRRHGEDLRPHGRDGRAPTRARSTTASSCTRRSRAPCWTSLPPAVRAAAVAGGVGRHRGVPLPAALAHPRRTCSKLRGDLGRHALGVLSAVTHRRARAGLQGRLRGDEPGGAATAGAAAPSTTPSS